MTYDIEKIKASNSIAKLVQDNNVVLKKKGAALVGLCPLHSEKSPSFTVFEKTQTFKCFGCGTGGDVITFMQAVTGCGFQEALKLLSEENPSYECKKVVEIEQTTLNIGPQWRRQFADTNKGAIEEHAKQLGVNAAMLDLLGIAWSQKQNSFFYPQWDAAGNVIGLRFRNRLGHKWSLAGGKNGIFIPSMKDYNVVPITVAIAEGPTDTAALLSMGIYAIGRPSATSGDELILAFLAANKSIERAIVISDRDSNNVGIAGAWRLHEQLPIPSRIFMPKEKDIREAYKAGLTRKEMFNEIERRNG